MRNSDNVSFAEELGEFFNSDAEDNLDVSSAHFFYPQKSWLSSRKYVVFMEESEKDDCGLNIVKLRIR